MLEKAEILANKNNVESRIELKIGSAENLPLPDNSVELFISSLPLHHWKNPQRSLEEIYRILTIDGMLLIFDFKRDARCFYYGLLTFATKIVVPKALKRINEPLGSLQAGYTPKEAKEIFSQTDFNQLEIDPFLAWMFLKAKKK